ncbi:transcription termination/antitermination NusG family protein [Prosthecomicrobium hirschii]|uniref:transcription termination/antitermination NusG family protein n=1 Tax=Prosthecodimorpha hirschii TaxID=665126 RepID=UPI00221EE294|nr:transcription termination/antitermination NusG family protein [Prosthecomicrobium hirschii]MCW1839451.1 transcription termination/antitermination NusG family protein [Prosthecomicrobium hirschii]
MDWYALTVRGGAELAVAGQEGGLPRYGIEAYLPVEVREVRVRHVKGVQRVERPLLPGYVFAALAPSDWAVLPRIAAVRGVVVVGDVPVRVRLADLERMRRIEREVAEQRGRPGGRVLLVRGARVEIVGTAMDGWAGTVANDPGTGAGRVLVDFGPRAVAVPLDAVKRIA